VTIECTAPEPVLRTRIAHRLRAGRDASDADDAVLDLQLRVSEGVTAEEGAIVLSTDCDLAALALRCEALAARLAAPPATIASKPTDTSRP